MKTLGREITPLLSGTFKAIAEKSSEEDMVDNQSQKEKESFNENDMDDLLLGDMEDNEGD